VCVLKPLQEGGVSLCGLVVRVWFPALPDFLREVGLEQGPLCLVSTIEELLGKKIVAAPV
jgi:hypothetical protein